MAKDASNSVAVAGSAATAASAGVAMSAATLFAVWIDRRHTVAVIGDLERDGNSSHASATSRTVAAT